MANNSRNSADLNNWLRHLPGKSFPLAFALAIAARYTATRLGESTAAGLPFGETTLTELTLLELKKAVPGLTICPISAAQEAKTGADWEFWIEGNNSWFGFLVQAKKSKRAGRDNRSKTTYDLGYRIRTNPDNYQIDALLAASRAQNLPAIYALYNNPNYRKDYVRDLCARQGPPAGLDGVTAVAAPEAASLLSLGRSRHTAVNINDVRRLARPWSCIAGCPAGRSCSQIRANGTPRKDGRALLQQRFPSGTPLDDEALCAALAVYSLYDEDTAYGLASKSSGVRAEAPRYVLQLRDRQIPIELPRRSQDLTLGMGYPRVQETGPEIGEPLRGRRQQASPELVPYNDLDSPAPKNLAVLWREPSVGPWWQEGLL